MAYASNHDSPLVRRRSALRAVPPAPHHLPAEPVARLVAPAGGGRLRRDLCASCGGAAALLPPAPGAGWRRDCRGVVLPTFYVSEARVLVGVQLPRLPNVKSIVADVSPDAERVRNEGFILQSRNIARQVIDQLRLRDDPEFIRTAQAVILVAPEPAAIPAAGGRRMDRPADAGQAEGCRRRKVHGVLHRHWRGHR